MSRGYVWGDYQSDDGHAYAWRTAANYFAMPERGWTGPSVTGTPVYPRFWSPRRVVGHDNLGRRQVAIVASITADLWTHIATTFVVRGNDGINYVCTVDSQQSEKMKMKP